MKLSILDQSPISMGQTAKEALEESVSLAMNGERLGYTRYWIAEHHDLPGFACPAPEIMLPYIGAATDQIRIGSGAVLLPHYSPYKVAENFNLLTTLFPGRIDLGVGRAPGGSAETSEALTGKYLENVWRFPELIDELTGFLNDDGVSSNPHDKLSASPLPGDPPHTWLLGTSRKSAVLAAEKGLSYAFGQFMSDQAGSDMIGVYKSHFQGDHPETIVAVSVVCAETEEEAEELALSPLIWPFLTVEKKREGWPDIAAAKSYKTDPVEREEMARIRKRMIVGNPNQVAHLLRDLQAHTGADELMILTNLHHEDRLNSYRLIAEQLLDLSSSRHAFHHKERHIT